MADKRLDQTTNASAVAAADNIPFVTAAGVTSYVTGDEMAASGPFSSRYVPTSGDKFFVPAAAFGPVYQSPSLTTVAGNQSAWFLDPSTDEWIGSGVYVPSWWSTYHVDIVWTINASASGDVRLGLLCDSSADGENLSSGTTSNTLNFTAPAQYVVKHSRILTSSTLALGQTLAMSVYRDGANAADTLTVDCAILGVLFVRAS